MENKNQTEQLFELECLCPTLAIMRVEGRADDYLNAVKRMNEAHRINTGSDNLLFFYTAIDYLLSLEQVEKETLAKFTIKGVENA